MARRHAFHDVAIAGAYWTKQARFLEGETSRTVTWDAVRGVLKDAGITLKDVDGVGIQVGMEPYSVDFAYNAGMGSVWTGPAIGTAAVMQAALAISAGYCHTVVLATGQAGIYTDRASVAPWTRPTNEFIECWGMMTPAEWALNSRLHMARYGTTPEQLATVAATVRNNGHRNPEAVYYGRGPFTPQDILASRMVADPFHLLDCSTTTEGGAALLLTTGERARSMKQKPAYVLGGASESFFPGYVHPPTQAMDAWIGRKAANIAFEQAGIRREDVDVAELYDNFSGEVIRYFELYGFCGEGEGGPFAASGAIAPGGTLPITTHGGTMSHSHTGISQLTGMVVESVRQIRGTSTGHQVPDAKIAIASNTNASVLLLGSEPAS